MMYARNITLVTLYVSVVRETIWRP